MQNSETPLPSPLRPNGVRAFFGRFASWFAYVAGTWQAFIAAFAGIVVWCLGGFRYGWASDSYQLVINTITSVITFLMVFLIQHAQNKETAALHAKLDGVIRALDGANNALIASERRSIDEINALRERLAASADGN